jgi:hypothetical protein
MLPSYSPVLCVDGAPNALVNVSEQQAARFDRGALVNVG